MDSSNQAVSAPAKERDDFHGMLDAFWQRFGRFVIRHNAWVTVSLHDRHYGFCGRRRAYPHFD